MTGVKPPGGFDFGSEPAAASPIADEPAERDPRGQTKWLDIPPVMVPQQQPHVQAGGVLAELAQGREVTVQINRPASVGMVTLRPVRNGGKWQVEVVVETTSGSLTRTASGWTRTWGEKSRRTFWAESPRTPAELEHLLAAT